MRWMLAAATFAAVTAMGAGAASATVCTNACDHNYSVCNTLNGGNAQGVCMPKWFQCKKTCAQPAKATTKVSNITAAGQKH